MQISDRTRLYEIIAAALTGIGKIVFINLIDFRLPYIIISIVGWLCYIIYRYRQEPDIIRYWGLGTEKFGSSFLQLLPVALTCVAIFVGVGYYFQTEVLDWSLVLILMLYPIWGILQQFIVLGIYSRNLADGWGGQRSEATIIGLTAVLFAIVHYPSPLLIVATFFLAIVYTWLFLRGSSILALGIYHGWLGGVFFYTVLGRNPWAEAFGSLAG
jgi:hypothetical protein